jgi:hypothetical protein
MHCQMEKVSRKSATIFGQGTIPELSTSHIGKGVALVALAAAFVYIYARIPQIAEMTLSFHATLLSAPWSWHFSFPSKITCSYFGILGAKPVCSNSVVTESVAVLCRHLQQCLVIWGSLFIVDKG